MDRYIGLAVLLALAGGCQDNPDPKWGRLSCTSGSKAVAGGCVPDEFTQVMFPNLARRPGLDTGQDGRRYLSRTLLVLFPGSDQSAAAATELAATQGGELTGAIPFGGFFQMEFPAAGDEKSLDAIAGRLSSAPGVAFVSRDFELDGSVLLDPPNPPDPRPRATDLEELEASAAVADFFGPGPDVKLGTDGRWAFERIGLAAAWDKIHAKNPVLSRTVVGVIDGYVSRAGVFAGLPLNGSHDLRVFGAEDEGSITVRHGTAVASIIGAPNDARGTTGMLAGLSCLKYDLATMAVTESAMGMAPPPPRGNMLLLDAIFYGVVHAVRAGARVVNISMGSPNPEPARMHLARNFRMVVSRAPSTLFVISAGNGDDDAATYWPGSAARTDEETQAKNVMTVAAVNDRELRATFYSPYDPLLKLGASSYDISQKTISIAAPGVRVLAQRPDGKLAFFGGTSAAAPLVSGAAALLFEILPGLDGADAKKILIDHAASISTREISGRRLDVSAAVEKALDYAARLDGSQIGQGDCRPPDALPQNACLDSKIAVDVQNPGYVGMLSGTIAGKPFSRPAAYLGLDGTIDPNDASFSDFDFESFGRDGNCCQDGDLQLLSTDLFPISRVRSGGTFTLTAPLQVGPGPNAGLSYAYTCPIGPGMSWQVKNADTTGTIEVTLSADCRGVTAKFNLMGTLKNPNNGMTVQCPYVATFTGKLP